MIGDTRDSEDDFNVIQDIEGSQVGEQTPDVTTSGGQGLWATTSRRELWSFYLFYVVRHYVVLACQLFVS